MTITNLSISFVIHHHSPWRFTPFYGLGPTVGSILWTWLGMAVYLIGLCRFARVCGIWSKTGLALVLALGCLGGIRGFWNAQANALVIGLLLIGLEAWVEERWWASAWYFAAAIIIKLTPLAVVLLFVALRPRELIGRVLLALMVFALVPFLVKPPMIVVNHYQQLLVHLAESGPERWPGFRDAWTVYQVFERQFNGLPGIPPLKGTMSSPGIYRCIQLLAAIAALGWCLWQQGAGSAEA